MRVRKFGTLLIVGGVFLLFACFIFADWRSHQDFMTNIRYAYLIELSPEVGSRYDSQNFKPASVIRLGQGLLLPILTICLGVILNRGVFDSKTVVKLLPFLKETEKSDGA